MRVVGAALIAVAVCSASCKSVTDWKLENAVDSLIGDIDGLFGASSAPAKHLNAIREVHESKRWVFRPDAEEALDKTRRAVRALASCDYTSWSEAAFVIEIVSEMADQHSSSLVRAEALDTLTRVAVWTLKAAVKPERPATNAEFIEALKTLKAAEGKTDSDPAFTFQVATAVSSLATFDFERMDLPATDRRDVDVAPESYGKRLGTSRAALKRIGGPALAGFQGDAGVRDAIERANVALSAAVVRLTLMKAALADTSDTTRITAVRNLGALAPSGGGPVLHAALLRDGSSSVRREAAAALEGFSADVAVPALIDGLADEMTDVRGAAASSLAAITGQSFGDDRGAWTRWWRINTLKSMLPGAGK